MQPSPCPKCGAPLTWAPAQASWYCYNDRQYFPAQQQPAPHQIAPRKATPTVLIVLVIIAVIVIAAVAAMLVGLQGFNPRTQNPNAIFPDPTELGANWSVNSANYNCDGQPHAYLAPHNATTLACENYWKQSSLGAGYRTDATLSMFYTVWLSNQSAKDSYTATWSDRWTYSKSNTTGTNTTFGSMWNLTFGDESFVWIGKDNSTWPHVQSIWIAARIGMVTFLIQMTAYSFYSGTPPTQNPSPVLLMKTFVARYFAAHP